MTASKKMMTTLVALKPVRTASAQCSSARWVRIPAATPPSNPSRRMRVERTLSSPALEEYGFNTCPSKPRLRADLQLDPIRMGQHDGSDQWGKHSFPWGFRRSLLSIMLRGTQGILDRTAVPSPGGLIISRCSPSSLTRRYMPWIAVMLLVRSASSAIVADQDGDAPYVRSHLDLHRSGSRVLVHVSQQFAPRRHSAPPRRSVRRTP
jgi:hypothetical protein